MKIVVPNTNAGLIEGSRRLQMNHVVVTEIFV